MSVVARSEIGKGIPFELFFICQWFERMYLCDFVALSVRMCVAGKSSGNCAWNLAFFAYFYRHLNQGGKEGVGGGTY